MTFVQKVFSQCSLTGDGRYCKASCNEPSSSQTYLKCNMVNDIHNILKGNDPIFLQVYSGIQISHMIQNSLDVLLIRRLAEYFYIHHLSSHVVPV